MGRKTTRGKASHTGAASIRKKDVIDDGPPAGSESSATRPRLGLAATPLADATSDESAAAFASAIEASIAQRCMPMDSAAPSASAAAASPRVLRGVAHMFTRLDAPCVDIMNAACSGSALDAAIRGIKCRSCRSATHMAYTLWRRRTVGYNAAAHDFPYSHTVVRAWIDLPIAQWERIAGMTTQRSRNAPSGGSSPTAPCASRDWFAYLRGRGLQLAPEGCVENDDGALRLDLSSLLPRPNADGRADLREVRAVLDDVWRESARMATEDDKKRAVGMLSSPAVAGRVTPAQIQSATDELTSYMVQLMRDLLCARPCGCALTQFMAGQGHARKAFEALYDSTFTESVISVAKALDADPPIAGANTPALVMRTLLLSIAAGPIPDLEHVAAQLAALDAWYDSNAVRATEFDAAEALHRELQELDARHTAVVDEAHRRETSAADVSTDAESVDDLPVVRMRSLLSDTDALEAQLQPYARRVWSRVILQHDRVPSGAAKAVAPHVALPPVTFKDVPPHHVPFFGDAALTAPESLTLVLRYVAAEHVTLTQCEVALSSLRERDAAFKSNLQTAMAAQRDAIAAAGHARAAELITAFRSTDVETASLEAVGVRLRLDAMRQMLDATIALLSKDQEGSDDVLVADLRDVGTTTAPSLPRYTYARTTAEAFGHPDRVLSPGFPPAEIVSPVDAFDDALLEYLMRGVVIGTVMLRKLLASLLCAPIVSWYREAAAEAARDELLLELEHEAAAAVPPAVKPTGSSSASSSASKGPRAAGSGASPSKLSGAAAGSAASPAARIAAPVVTPTAAVTAPVSASAASSAPAAAAAAVTEDSPRPSPPSRTSRVASRTAAPTATPAAGSPPAARPATAAAGSRRRDAARKPDSKPVATPSVAVVQAVPGTAAAAVSTHTEAPPPASVPALVAPPEVRTAPAPPAPAAVAPVTSAHASTVNSTTTTNAAPPLHIPPVHWEAIQRGDAATVAAYAWELVTVKPLLSQAAREALHHSISEASPPPVTLSSLAASLGFNAAHGSDGVHASAGGASGPLRWCAPSTSVGATDWSSAQQVHTLTSTLAGAPAGDPTRAWVDSLLLGAGDAVSSPARPGSDHRWTTLDDVQPQQQHSAPPRTDRSSLYSASVTAPGQLPPERRTMTPSTDLTDSSGERAAGGRAAAIGSSNPFSHMRTGVDADAIRSNPRVRRASTSRLGDAWSAGTGDADAPPVADSESAAAASAASLAAVMPHEHEFTIERALGASPPVFMGAFHQRSLATSNDSASLQAMLARGQRADDAGGVAISAPSPFEDAAAPHLLGAAGTPWSTSESSSSHVPSGLFSGGGLLPSMDTVGDGFFSASVSPMKPSVARTTVSDDTFIPVGAALSAAAAPFMPNGGSRILPFGTPLPLVGAPVAVPLPSDCFPWSAPSSITSWPSLQAPGAAGNLNGHAAASPASRGMLSSGSNSISVPSLMGGTGSHSALLFTSSGSTSASPMDASRLQQSSILWGGNLNSTTATAPMARSLLSAAMSSPSPVDATLRDVDAAAGRWSAATTPIQGRVASVGQPPLPPTAPPPRSVHAAAWPAGQYMSVPL